MLPEFARLVQEIFPSITPGAAKHLIAQSARYGFVAGDLFASQLGDRLCQGDVIDQLRWVVPREDGGFGLAKRSAMLLSHSCDVDGGGYLVFAACHPYDEGAPNAREIKANQVYDQYFLPRHGSRPALVADLSLVQSMGAEMVMKGLAENTLHRIDTFTSIGHWHFLSKVAMHLLRPQPADEVRHPSIPPLRDRARYTLSAAMGLTHYLVVGRSQ